MHTAELGIIFLSVFVTRGIKETLSHNAGELQQLLTGQRLLIPADRHHAVEMPSARRGTMQPPVNASPVSRAILANLANLSAQATKSVRVTWPVLQTSVKTLARECVADMLSVPSTTTTQTVSVTRDIPAILSMFVIGYNTSIQIPVLKKQAIFIHFYSEYSLL
eukprot:TRINITY_DN74232_c0_g1_i1.p2 TRINITY_DN74232_c0_g1~~TRINITY_DN74232_c0_g1_i1.p2  ORF type:complete len:164 (+),score=10.25 TRINITY_DN74232_c0_g1_i1:112-603(+)